MLSDVQFRQYLDRISYTGPLTVELSTLTDLQKAHMTQVPYENLDILDGIPLSVDPSDLFHKIVERRRGGFCFELQGGYKQLLQAVGFPVSQYAARMLFSPRPIHMRNHRVLVASVGDKRYFTDVGILHECPRTPLQLTPELVQTDGLCDYRFTQDPYYGWVLWQKVEGKDWQTCLGFTEEPQEDSDYAMPCFYCEKHPDSPFNKYFRLSIFKDRSNFTLEHGLFREFRDGVAVQEQELTDPADIQKVMREVFLIES